MVRNIGLLLSMVALGACVPNSTPPVSAPPPQPQVQRPAPIQPAPVQRPAPVQTARPVAAGPSSGWSDAPLSPGAWTYRGAGLGGSAAFFGPRGASSFAIRCEPGRRVSLSRGDGVSGNALTLRTHSAARSVTANAAGAGQPGLVAILAADDPVLDALAFSRGRFAVEAAGAPTLIVPAWPELARVVEDCRR